MKTLPEVTESNVLETDTYDHILYSGIRDSSTKITAMVGTDGLVDSLVSDVFLSLYKSNPTIREDARGISKKLIETMHGLPEFQSLRPATKFDDVCSAIVTLKLAPNVIEEFRRVQKEMDQRKQNAKHSSGGKDDVGPVNPRDFGGDLSDEIRVAIRAAMKEAQAEAEKWEEICAGWGIEQGDLKNLPYGEKLELANKLKEHDQFKRIAELAGRFRNMALSAAATTPAHGTDEIVDIVQGNDIARLLPTELLKLKRNPALFMGDMLEGKLLQYNLRGTENLGHGPIIVCLDISASMSGSREVWAKAVILALMFLAERQKRAFGVITFDVQARFKKFFPKDRPPTLKEKIEIVSVASDGGGTDFYSPLKAAFEMRQQDAAALKPSDIVFITDGECAMTKPQMTEIINLKKTTFVRILGIGINDSSFRDGCDTFSLANFSDNLARINSLGDIEHVKGILSKTASLTTVGRK